ncbi:uncharacterized protein MELLADRAFT_69697 [Melampsora larici-populina 98AG31]|uniref:Tet-like 2OG-Fe(II) oxygenase domain-containing protein n=1 Tax=Melampsora larici-populina (strain 98AG31 / pathotype 3-4-7) TaxID=747676 RepID=F4SBT0_MELLP|nr:uncharacterized protein MELLADRAFT_69697 [Melampsora larici-populina 98AG31]EGF97881.1 hypothetical protein MELLADRAFT_69697 [Melampsora larici-populina 98AG31]
MYAAGFRPGFEADVKGATAADLYKMEEDLKRQGNLPRIESFFAERFSGLSLSAFESNTSIAARTHAPSWANESFYWTESPGTFTSEDPPHHKAIREVPDASDSVIEMLWNSQVHHHTTPSKTYNARGVQVGPAQAEITRFACSCQISQALVNRIDKVKSLQSEMGEDVWVVYQSAVLTGYKEQAHKKMKTLALKLGIWKDDF